MKLKLEPLNKPNVWSDLEGVWADKETYDVSAQILLGADQVNSFPIEDRDDQGKMLRTNHVHLMKSQNTGNYIIFGSCGSKHSKQPTDTEFEVQTNRVQGS